MLSMLPPALGISTALADVADINSRVTDLQWKWNAHGGQGMSWSGRISCASLDLSWLRRTR